MLKTIKSLILLFLLAVPAWAEETDHLLVAVSGLKNPDLTVIVAMSVYPNGELSALMIRQSSGNPEFDGTVLHTIAAAMPDINAQQIRGLQFNAVSNKFILPSW